MLPTTLASKPLFLWVHRSQSGRTNAAHQTQRRTRALEKNNAMHPPRHAENISTSRFRGNASEFASGKRCDVLGQGKRKLFSWDGAKMARTFVRCFTNAV